MHQAHSPAARQPVPVIACRWLSAALVALAFLGSFLLFQVQPLLGKAILPWYGGAPSVWTTALLVFQSLLVVGYASVDAARRWLSPAMRSYVFIALAAACWGTLGILPGAEWKPHSEDDPLVSVLRLLLVCVGGPYCLLSTTGPLTQAWWVQSGIATTPYRLYALSNLGSLLGLLTYPLVVEPLWDLRQQAFGWSVGFTVYAGLLSWCAWQVRTGLDTPTTARPHAVPRKGSGNVSREQNSRRETFAWLGLSSAGSILLLATTNNLCQDMASAPLLWIVLLAAYLLSFIICFEWPSAYRRTWVAAVVVLSIPWACQYTASVGWMVAAHVVMLLAVCLFCHGELALRRPSERRLTWYYLIVSLGGALGGVFVSVIAPVLFVRYWEWTIATVVAYVFASACIVDALKHRRQPAPRWLIGLGGSVLACGLVLLVWQHRAKIRPEEVDAARNFYGVVHVDAITDEATQRVDLMAMRHGGTTHGMQVFFDGSRRLPTTYYGPLSGIGQALLEDREATRSRRVGIVGLGVGTLATYAKPGDQFRFYEINPVVIHFAQEYFTFLRDCTGTVENVAGDARQSLEHESPQAYDLFVVDAFSGDAIPTHLLTHEAFQAYLRHVREDGLLAVHISNRHLELSAVVTAAAEAVGLSAYLVEGANDSASYQYKSRWILACQPVKSQRWSRVLEPPARPLRASADVRLWTDQYSNLLQIMGSW